MTTFIVYFGFGKITVNPICEKRSDPRLHHDTAVSIHFPRSDFCDLTTKCVRILCWEILDFFRSQTDDCTLL